MPQSPTVRMLTEARADTKYLTAVVTGDPDDPDVTLYLNGVEL